MKALGLDICPELTAKLGELAAEVERLLLQSTMWSEPSAQQIARHLLTSGGKRLRPLLVLLAAQLGTDPNAEQVFTSAVVVELTHLATLYHDDVMDSSDLRRGEPTTHTVWGNNVAILTGDLLFARASQLVADLGPPAVKLQAETFERLCLGQLRETIGANADDDPIEFYLSILSDKTASLTGVAARFGAMFSGCDLPIQQMVAKYGEYLGVAFQLADDVIDICAEKSGKPMGNDLRERVETMPVLLLRRAISSGSATKEDRELAELLDGDLSDDAVLATVCEQLSNSRFVEETRTMARQWAVNAQSSIESLPPSSVKDALKALAIRVVEREH
jgi:heptaprenyl diphosphate synthase